MTEAETENQINSTEESFEQAQARFKLKPITDSELTNKFTSGIQNPAIRYGYEGRIDSQRTINPWHLYEGKDRNFFGIWIIAHPYGSSSYSNIGWKPTIENLGKEETVHDVLDTYAYCFDQADKIYDWKTKVGGFSMVANNNFGMEQGNAYGIQVSFPNSAVYIARAINNKDAARLRKNAIFTTGEFIHERAHNEFDEMGFGGPEAVTQGCQFLYMPGENIIFESQIKTSIDKAKQIQSGESGDRLFGYNLGNIVWITFMERKLAERFPEKFKALGTDGNKNMDELEKLIPGVADLKRDLGDQEWDKLRRTLMQELLEYDKESQGTIIRGFERDAGNLGFDKLVGK